MKFIKILGILLILIYAGILSYFYFDLFTKNKKLTLLYDESQALKRKLGDEVSQLNSKQNELQKENEQIKKESLDYLKRQQEISQQQELLEKNIKKQAFAVKESSKRLQEAKKELQKLKEENLRLSDISDLAGNIKVKKQEEKVARLESDLKSAAARMKRQEVLLHYNLGVSYTKEKNFEPAIDEYEKALSLNPNDADTHYNLAVLYDDFRKNPKRSLEHYKKYLELRPEAPDIDEVKEWIERLEKME